MDEQILTMIDLLNPAGAEEHTNGGYEAVVDNNHCLSSIYY